MAKDFLCVICDKVFCRNNVLVRHISYVQDRIIVECKSAAVKQEKRETKFQRHDHSSLPNQIGLCHCDVENQGFLTPSDAQLSHEDISAGWS